MNSFPVKKIGIIGGGVVGKALFRAYLGFCDVQIWDKQVELSTVGLITDVTKNADLVFLCLPTPQKTGTHELDISAIHDVFRLIKMNNYSGELQRINFVLKSTVPIGTTESLHKEYQIKISHSPEFLTERTAYEDAQMPAVNFIGLPEDMRECFLPAESSTSRSLLYNLYKSRFPGVKVNELSSNETEAIKLITNAFFATKITFFNEVYQLCNKLSISWEDVRSGILADGRISHSHTEVPGPDGGMGYGGKCLPKDTIQLMRHICGKDGGIVESILQTVIKSNSLTRKS